MKWIAIIQHKDFNYPVPKLLDDKEKKLLEYLIYETAVLKIDDIKIFEIFESFEEEKEEK